MGKDEASAFACNLVLSTCIKAGAWKEAGQVCVYSGWVGGWINVAKACSPSHPLSTHFHSPTHPPP